MPLTLTLVLLDASSADYAVIGACLGLAAAVFLFVF